MCAALVLPLLFASVFDRNSEAHGPVAPGGSDRQFVKTVRSLSRLPGKAPDISTPIVAPRFARQRHSAHLADHPSDRSIHFHASDGSRDLAPFRQVQTQPPAKYGAPPILSRPIGDIRAQDMAPLRWTAPTRPTPGVRTTPGAALKPPPDRGTPGFRAPAAVPSSLLFNAEIRFPQ